MDWNDQTKARLRALWGEGMTTPKIGKELGCSKNAVVSMARRMDLPARPSPIRAAGEGPNVAKPRRAHPGAATLPPLSTESAGAPSPLPTPRPLPAPPASTPLAVPSGSPLSPSSPGLAPRPAPAPSAPPRPAFVRPSRECCWPIGEPGDKAFRFCEDPAVPGKPYCPDHQRKAFVPAPRRQDHYAA